MTQYTTRPQRTRAIDYQMDPADIVHPGTITVHEPEEDGRPTGILDKHGQEFWASERGPMGFQLRGQS